MKKLIKMLEIKLQYIRTQQQQNNIPLEYFCSLDKPKVGELTINNKLEHKPRQYSQTVSKC